MKYLGISKVTYELQGAQNKEETEIEDGGNINISGNGEITLIFKTYDRAGNIKETTQTIKKDNQKPQNVAIEASEITSTSFKLTATGKDEESGILKYEIYLDDNKYATFNTEDETVSIDITEQQSGIHEAYVVVYDKAGNIIESEKINIITEKLKKEDIDYVEFEITSFYAQNDVDELDNEKIEAIVSDTSITDQSKYIQITLRQNGTKATMEGKIKVIRKDGCSVEELAYFPEDLIITVSQLADGSGSSFKHNVMSQVFGSKIYDTTNTDELPLKTISILIGDVAENENRFGIEEKKLNGVSAYTRFIVESVTLGDSQIPFKIVQNK